MAKTLKKFPLTLNSFRPLDEAISTAGGLKFENLDGSKVANVEFPLIVDRKSSAQTNYQIPDWVKNSAGWWANEQIPDSAFIGGIEFLIKDGIIVISDIQQSESQTDGIPEWVKNNAGWWATGSISEKEFLNAIEYLVKFGIINIKNSNLHNY
mgnify:CR=1 FL=1